jgi:hypothetical protein
MGFICHPARARVKKGGPLVNRVAKNRSIRKVPAKFGAGLTFFCLARRVKMKSSVGEGIAE